MEGNKILITPTEGMKLLGVGRNAIYELCSQKDFPAMRIGSKVYINKEALQDWADKKCRLKK